jgi:hypothetical protein
MVTKSEIYGEIELVVKPDYEQWGKMEYWTLIEACFLLTNVNPSFQEHVINIDGSYFDFIISTEVEQRDSRPICDTWVDEKVNEYNRILNIVTRAFEMGNKTLNSITALKSVSSSDLGFENVVWFTPHDFLNWACGKELDIPKGLMAILNKGNQKATNIPYMNKEHPFFAEGLEMGVLAWMHLYEDGNFIKKKCHKDQIREWLKEHYPKLNPTATERIATVVNPNKKGGAPSME